MVTVITYERHGTLGVTSLNNLNPKSYQTFKYTETVNNLVMNQGVNMSMEATIITDHDAVSAINNTIISWIIYNLRLVLGGNKILMGSNGAT